MFNVKTLKQTFEKLTFYSSRGHLAYGSDAPPFLCPLAEVHTFEPRNGGPTLRRRIILDQGPWHRSGARARGSSRAPIRSFQRSWICRHASTLALRTMHASPLHKLRRHQPQCHHQAFSMTMGCRACHNSQSLLYHHRLLYPCQMCYNLHPHLCLRALRTP
jgi:hypothetical protein